MTTDRPDNAERPGNRPILVMAFFTVLLLVLGVLLVVGVVLD